MASGHSILVVSPTMTLAHSLQVWLAEAGYHVTVVSTFAAAKSRLRTLPDALITEVRLADFNGLHLALYAQAESIPTVVLGDTDPVVEAQTAEFGAVFMRRGDVSRREFLSQVDRLISAAPPRPHVDDLGVASDLEWSVAPEVMHERRGTHARRLTQH